MSSRRQNVDSLRIIYPMRTSRISRETAQIINALSPGRGTRSRRSAQQYSHDAANGSRVQSSTPKEEPSPAGGSLGKRKRDVSATPSKSIVVEQTAVRRSPRKAGEEISDPTLPRKPRRQPARRIKGPNGSERVEPPENWETTYSVTASMRKRVLAPVDTMGCESLAEEHRTPREQRLQTLVSLMLSSQTKDTVTAAAMKNLQANLSGGLCLDGLLNVEPVELNRLIEKVGFHNNKTKFIKSVAEILRDSFDGDIPDTIEGLVSLPGVGPKMAYLCMSAAWGRDEGIGVDVHVHRITNLWGWHKTSTPEQTRAELEAWLPKEKWHDINHLLVGLGQTICLPVGRKCGDCDLAEQGLCPSAEVAKVNRVRKKAKRVVELNVQSGEGEAVKSEAIKVEADAAAIKVEAEAEDGGQVEVEAFGSSGLDTEEEKEVT